VNGRLLAGFYAVRRPHDRPDGTRECAAAQAWDILSSLDDWIAWQPSLVTRRQLLPVVRDRMQVSPRAVWVSSAGRENP